jgi:hypothetical protein
MRKTRKRYSETENYYRRRIKNIKLTKDGAEAVIESFAL